MDKTVTFEAIIEQDPQSKGCFVLIPFDLKALYGSSRIKVQATFDGVPYRGSTMKYSGSYMMVLRKEIRLQLAKEPGDRVLVTMTEDDAPRTVDVPTPLKELLANDATWQAAFERMSYTHRKEWAEAIASAKRPETRQKRAEKCIAYLRERYLLP